MKVITLLLGFLSSASLAALALALSRQPVLRSHLGTTDLGLLLSSSHANRSKLNIVMQITEDLAHTAQQAHDLWNAEASGMESRVLREENLTQNSAKVVAGNVRHEQFLKQANAYPDVHLIYSIGCSNQSSYGYQLIQALTLDYSWAQHRQPGRLTRIVSGCEDDAAKKAAMEQTSLMRDTDLARFSVWFTSKNETLPDGSTYVMLNRPTALIKYFATQATEDHVIYGILDPDFVFLKPLPISTLRQVAHGRPVAAYYDLGSLAPKWPIWGRSICEDMYGPGAQVCEAFEKVTPKRSKQRFEAGAPYLMFRADWQRVLTPWISMMLPMRKFWKMIESDMYAYMAACVLLGLDHYIAQNLMKTCMVDDRVPVTEDDVFIHYCKQYFVTETRGGAYNMNKIMDLMSPNERAYLQSRGLTVPGYAYMFSKYWLRVHSQRWVFDCEAPLLVEPPRLGEHELNTFMDPGPLKKNYKVLWLLVPAINNAVTAYKHKTCDSQGRYINLRKLTLLHMGKSHPKGQWNSILSEKDIVQ